MIEEEIKQFEYCDKVDLHALELSTPLDAVVSIAGEHGFRGIVVTPGKLASLVKEINKPNYGCQNIIPICAIDYPYGNSSIDVRTYSVTSAKENGAKEIEIVAPYHLIVEKDFRHVYEDIQSILTAAKKYEIAVKYVLDLNSPFIDDAIRTKLCRVMTSTRVPAISTSLGFYDENIDHGDNILKMRNIKNKVGCTIKTFVRTNDPNSFAMYPKAGVDIIGVDWKKGPFLAHAYEEMVLKKS
jgi:deoxyribose-phosphate aldolase